MKDLGRDKLEYASKIILNIKERLLKRHEIIKSDIELSLEYSRVVDSFHYDVGLAVRVLNNMSLLDSSYIKTGVRTSPADLILESYLTSILWNGKLDTVPVKSNIYKARFIINMLLNIDSNFEHIIAKELKYRGKKKNHKEAINLIYQIRDCIGNFISYFASNNVSYRDELFKISELIGMADSFYSKNAKEVLETVSKQILRLEDMLTPGFLDGERPSDDIILQNVCLLAYVLVTGSPNVNNTLLVPEEVTIKDSTTIKGLVEILGQCIIDKREKYESKELEYIDYPDVYRWYLTSLPKIYYKFGDINYNSKLAEGCRALSYLAFYSNSRPIEKIISKMIY